MKSKWSLEKLQEEANKYTTRSKLMRGNYAAYQAAKRLNVMEQVCSHMPKRVGMAGENNPRFKWNEEKILTEALKYHIKSNFIKHAYGAYKAAKKFGILQKVCSHMKIQNFNGENNPNFRWSLEKLQEEANKYNSKKDFLNANPAAYSAADKRGILNKICEHMTEGYNSWNYKKINEVAKKYIFRSDFEKNDLGAYKAAFRMGIMDEICVHMPIRSSESRPEKELASFIKEYYPTSTKLRKRNINILNKPHIYGLDIDIYIPELKLGVEFDGTYHHSFRGLKRSKPHWPDKDIKKYHEIKDSYFKSIGIKILHIKEKDFLKNKGKCFQRCLDFLKSTATI